MHQQFDGVRHNSVFKTDLSESPFKDSTQMSLHEEEKGALSTTGSATIDGDESNEE